MNDVKEVTKYDVNSDQLIISRTQDVEPYIEYNKRIRNEAPSQGRYKDELPRAAHIPNIVVEQMMRGQCCTSGKKYNLLSPDQDEVRRALMHIQEFHKELLLIPGKPFARQRVRWQ